MRRKVIIFDFDGTIADTLDAFISISNSFAPEYGYPLIDAQELLKLRDLPAREIIKYSGLSLIKIPILAKKIKTELKHRIHDLKLIDGIGGVLSDLHNQGHVLGIITSNSQENVVEFLNRHNLSHIFDFIYSGVTIFGKTAIINNVLRQKQFKAEEVIYVGDEIRDIESAKKSKIKIIAVSWGFNSPESLSKKKPDFLIHLPSELPVVIQAC